MKKYFKKCIATLIFNFFAVFTALFFAPLEVYLGNLADFEIFPRSAVLVLLFCAAGITLAVTAVESLLPIKTLKVINITVLALGLCFYLQSMFFNGALITMTGDKNEISAATVWGNLGLWVVLAAAVFILWRVLKKAKKEKLFLSVSKFVCIAVVLMQAVGFFSLYLSASKTATGTKQEYFSSVGELEVSANNNVLYFIIDYCDADIVQKALAEFPDLFDGFDGFTYFPDASPVHSRTYPSVPYMLTGEKCYYNLPYTEFVNQAFQKGTFMSDIAAGDTDIRLYTPVYFIGNAAKPLIANYRVDDGASLQKVNWWGFLKSTIKISAFRGLPYAAKPLFEYTSADVNADSLNHATDYAVISDDLDFYNKLNTTGLKVNAEYSNAFRLYHMYGSHPGAEIDENVQPAKDEPLHHVLKGDMQIIRTYLEQLKALGVYDKTTVIITADHGHVNHNTVPEMPVAAGVMMMAKPAGADASAPLRISQAPVSHADLFATAVSALGGDGQKYGPTLFEVSETEPRDRYFYYTALYTTTDGEIALREYKIDGKAYDLSSYKLTGNDWDVDYSIYTVSKQRLEKAN